MIIRIYIHDTIHLSHPANDLTVVVGQLSLSLADPGEETISVSLVQSHPGYLISTHINNIAMLKVCIFFIFHFKQID